MWYADKMKIVEYKLEITEDEQVIEMPECVFIHSVQLQFNEIILWVTVDENSPTVNRTFILRATGSDVDAGDAYIGTVQTQLVKATYHLFQIYN